ncbi:hypothetical protein LIY46_11310 [Fusobacterium varium]|uniref:hypothetical protein n=1 Tax=Fusobacterium TaxID=848 RepID=UPI00102FE148|nr:hypothetical protein [Fusobacterium ulcerans]
MQQIVLKNVKIGNIIRDVIFQADTITSFPKTLGYVCEGNVTWDTSIVMNDTTYECTGYTGFANNAFKISKVRLNLTLSQPGNIPNKVVISFN